MSLESYRKALREQEQRMSELRPEPDIKVKKQAPSPEVIYVQTSEARPTYYVEVHQKTNQLGKAGFIFAILSVLTLLATLVIPFAILIAFGLGALGFLFSFIGLFKSPRGYAIAGFLITIIPGLIALTLLMLGLTSFASV